MRSVRSVSITNLRCSCTALESKGPAKDSRAVLACTKPAAVSTAPMTRRLLCVGALLLASSVSSLTGQTVEAQMVADSASCSSCEISFSLVDSAVIDLGEHYYPRKLVPIASGGFLLTTFGGGAYLVRPGQAPAAWPDSRGVDLAGGVANAFALPGDSVLVIDNSSTATVMDIVGRSFRRIKLPFPIGNDAVVRWPTLVVNADSRERRRLARPLHVIDLSSSSATVTRSFGRTGDGFLPPSDQGQMYRQIDDVGSGPHVWVAHQMQYRLEHWDWSDGRLVQALERDPAWFPGPSPWSVGGPSEEPPPFIVSIHEDEGGLLWVFARVSSSRWQEAWEGRDVAADGHLRSAIRLDLLYATRVDVIDPRTGTLVHSTIWPRTVVYVQDLGEVLTYSHAENGATVLRRWRGQIDGIDSPPSGP